MARHAIVNKENKVVNVVIWEGAEWLPPRNHLVVHDKTELCNIGDMYDPKTNLFIKPSSS
jgi:hypothetical protein